MHCGLNNSAYLALGSTTYFSFPKLYDHTGGRIRHADCADWETMGPFKTDVATSIAEEGKFWKGQIGTFLHCSRGGGSLTGR